MNQNISNHPEHEALISEPALASEQNASKPFLEHLEELRCSINRRLPLLFTMICFVFSDRVRFFKGPLLAMGGFQFAFVEQGVLGRCIPPFSCDV